jgi:hypothetical protein
MAWAAVAQIIVTGLLAWVVYLSTAKIARLEFSRSLRDAWVGVDELALADQATLQAADTLLAQKPGSETIDFARKRWFILAYLNPINTAWQGAHEGIFGSRKDEILAGVKAQLEALLVDDDAYWVSQNHGHEKAFRELCTEIRQTTV